jgi:hypothetical protein
MDTFLLIDAARLEMDIYEAKKINSDHICLYKGFSQAELHDVAPYLFSLVNGSDFYNWYLEKGWIHSWGYILKSKYTFEELYRHFRKFLLIKTEEDKEFYFRFYDPRVLKIFLPTCDEKQIKEFFGPIESFIVEGDTKEEAIRFWQQNGILQEEVLSVEAVFGKVAVETTNDNNK